MNVRAPFELAPQCALAAPIPTGAPSPYQTFSAPVTVTLKDATAGVPIYYTTDGSVPTTSSTPYTAPFTVSTTTQIRAIAAGMGYGPSAIFSATYNLAAAAPVITPAFGTFTGPKQVTITDTTAGATIYYTTDGTTPTTSLPASNQCASPCSFTVSSTSGSATVKAIAAAANYSASGIASAAYVFVTATPTITPGFGTFTGPKAGTVTDTTAGATIYYTTDGTPPTTSLPPCASPCSLVASSTETLKAIAAGGNYGASSVATASLVNQIKQSNITNNSVEAGTYSSFGVVFSATVPTVVPSGAVNSSLRFLASLARLSHVTRARWASRGG